MLLEKQHPALEWGHDAALAFKVEYFPILVANWCVEILFLFDIYY